MSDIEEERQIEWVESSSKTEITPLNTCSDDTNQLPSQQPKAVEEVIIYDVLHTSEKRWIIIAGGLIGLLLPFTDTIYLPALANVATKFQASPAEVTATVSISLHGCGSNRQPCVGTNHRLLWSRKCHVHRFGVVLGLCIWMFICRNHHRVNNST